MKYVKLIFVLIIATLSASCVSVVDLKYDDVLKYKYDGMSMMDRGPVVQRFADKEGRLFWIIYEDGPDLNEIYYCRNQEFRDRVKVARNGEIVRAIRQILRNYLRGDRRADNCINDATSAICIINEPELKVHNVIWMGGGPK